MKKLIHTYGDPVLRVKARPVEKVDDSIRALVRDMIETMRVERGVGLAAEQVGEAVAVCVIEVPLEMDRDEQGLLFNPGVAMPMAFINPRLVSASRETETADEGCLSFPGLYVPIPRPVEITVDYLDLHGVLLVDHMSAMNKIALSGQIRRLKRQTREQLAGQAAGR
jgi:peptide deformylase